MHVEMGFRHHVANRIEKIEVMMTLDDCAEEGKLSRRFLEKRIEDGEIAVFRPSTRLVRIKRSEWERWIESYTHTNRS
jgi:excisionase family DNA binding protein